MQSVSDAWSVEEISSHRSIVGNLLVSWKKDRSTTNRQFQIGISSIGGPDIIGANPGAIGSPGQYRYFDESDYLLGVAYERSLSQPIGGLNKALAEALLDNTSGRFLPDYMGGNSELHTAILPRRPFLINAGFNFEGIDQTIPQFAGTLVKTPKVDVRGRQVQLEGADYTDFFWNRYVDDESMFTSERSDVVLETILQSMGMATSQYELDTGMNIIRFGLFPRGSRWADHIHEIVQAENGQFYQDEEGKFRFENRQHWTQYPHFNVQRDISTAQVLEAELPGEDHIINVVEVKGTPREVEDDQIIYDKEEYAGGEAVLLSPGVNTDVWVNFNDPIFAFDTPTAKDTSSTTQTSYFGANTQADGTGTDITSSVTLVGIDKFTQASRLVFRNNHASAGYLNELVLWGRPARRTGDIYYREVYGSSVTDYEERAFKIENQYIQEPDWAQSLAGMILESYAQPENLQKLTIRAIPELQLGDLVSWQGRNWQIFNIESQLNPSVGFVQELTMLQRTIVKYFQIGISSIGSSDQIAF